MKRDRFDGDNPLGIEPVNNLLVQYAIPSIVAMLVGALYNIVDQIFIGQKIGELGNAATNVAFPLSTSCVAISLLLGIGGASSFNLALGKGDREKAVFYIGNASVMLFVLGVTLSPIVQVTLTSMLKFFGSPDEVLSYAKTYTRITSLGFPLLILSHGGAHLIRADGSPRYAMYSNLVGAIINTVLDPIFIFIFDMDMAGAALATVIGQLFSFLMVIHYFRNFKTVQLIRKHFIPKWRYIKKIVTIGAAPAFNQVAMMIVQIVMNKSLTYYGGLSAYGESIPLASAGIINKVGMIFFSVVIGISQGMQPIVSFNYGAGKFDRVKNVFKLAIRWGLVVSTLAFISFQLIPRQIISIFGSGSDEYFEFAVSYFRIYMFFTFVNFVQPMSSNLFTAIGKAPKGIFLSLTRQIIFLLPFIVTLPLWLGIDGIMFAGPIADFAAALVSAIMVLNEFRNMKRVHLS